MARIRTIKPGFFRHEQLFDAEKETGLPLRVAYAGLWTACDREGRFVWAPRQLKLDCLPHDDVDFSRVLDALWTRGFIVKYAIEGREFGYVPSWKDHQIINNREVASKLPEPNDNNTLTRGPRVTDASATRHGFAQGEYGREGKGTEDAASPVVPPGALVRTGEVLEFERPVQGPPAARNEEADLFERGKSVLGPTAGGLIKNLLKAKNGNIALARSAIELASTKQNPREYIGAIIAGRESKEDLRARGDAW